MTHKADIGLIGLAVMGQNLVLNMADHGYTVAVYNRTTERTDEFLAGPASGTSVIGTSSLEELVSNLTTPRRVMMLIRAGSGVDAVIDQLIPLLEPGDVIIDGGNSLYTDSIRRAARVEEAGMLFVGTGISGGEEGARYGPSLMPGGSAAAWPIIKEIFQGVAAKLSDGTPCCDWVGNDGAGHFTKMVHNGIEYGDMQLIAEAYHLMSTGLGMSPDALRQVFAGWNAEKLESYLVEITAEIMGHRDGGELVLDTILDAAGQKGTGKWTVISSMELGSPTPLVAEAVYARILSSHKELRLEAAASLGAPAVAPLASATVSDIRDALHASKIVSYAQGFMLLADAGVEHGWDLDFSSIATMWAGGTIIRSVFLSEIRQAFAADSDLENLLLNQYFAGEVGAAEEGWRRVVGAAVAASLPAPAFGSALAFYDGFRTERLPANLIQAQRDYFGAHTYERVDRPRGEYFHSDWTGSGGPATAGSYQA
ncbi:MAG: decarboxylating NADP(+)-dependent phosphogluconate dehydrogenase [Acidimicrobiia bacterium]|nr:decarboxylating NADP(+)-dependent phosphogluconate dehydrogenase [Acidimicrobiia bacterium]